MSDLTHILKLLALGHTTVPAVLAAAQEARYTGAVTIHLRAGVPLKADVGTPIQLTLQPEPDPVDAPGGPLR